MRGPHETHPQSFPLGKPKVLCVPGRAGQGEEGNPVASSIPGLQSSCVCLGFPQGLPAASGVIPLFFEIHNRPFVMGLRSGWE